MSSKGWGVSSADVGVFTNHQSKWMILKDVHIFNAKIRFEVSNYLTHCFIKQFA